MAAHQKAEAGGEAPWKAKPPPKPPVAKGRKQGVKAIIKDEEAMADLRKVWPKLAAQLPKLVKAEEQGGP